MDSIEKRLPGGADRAASQPRTQEDHPSICSNCGAIVEEQFCSRCGQSLADHRRPLLGLLRDFFTTVFDLDARFLRSLRILCLQPGRLSLLYLEGRRASLLPPARMYLVLSLLLFFFVDIPVPEARNFNLYVGGKLVGREVEDPSLGRMEIGTTPEGQMMPILAPILEEKESKLQTMEPQLLLNKIFTKIEGSLSKALILFIPLLALILKLLFFREKRLYYDHVIFALHFQSFFFLLILTAWAISWLHTGGFLLLLLAPIYLGLALHEVYGKTWPRTLLQLLFLLMSYFMALTTVLGLTFATIIFRI